ncbi:uncharacterized protein LOC142180015 [Nicotiana tabacum]|uniref:Uncharacterized protein LOC142180015 n=1 Tax=Nicotiana tabacum TaxID=4097 RepID=A0AC58UC16_TOBAC
MGSEKSSSTSSDLPSCDDSSGNIIDHNHPLYIHLSDNLGLSLVSNIFDGTWYSDWRRSMLIALSVKNKLCFIQPDYKKPPPNSPHSHQWDMYIWIEFEDRYGHPSGIRIYQVKRELSLISQGNMNIPKYNARKKSVWDELSTLTVHSDFHCTCGGGRLDIQKHEEDQKLYHFLMGLNESYANARSNLLMMNHFPNINKAYFLLVTDERQREIQPPPYQFISTQLLSQWVLKDLFLPKQVLIPGDPM